MQNYLNNFYFPYHPSYYYLLSLPLPSHSKLQTSSQPIPDNDPTFSNLLSGLQMENPGRDETVLSHAQSIANLGAQGRSTAEVLRRQAKAIKELSSSLTVANEVIAAKPNYQAELLQIRTGASKDDYVGKCASQTWWRGLLSRNAEVQGLDTKLASSAEDYVIEELLSIDSFLVAINKKFVNTSESDDDWKELEALRQGKKSMSDFNIQFTTLLRQLHPKPEQKAVCDYYDKAVDQDVKALG
ncbi:hypothetical protein PSHT_00742 [Puccinia striiformis]|uniref:Uncharacterized protein n=1 Tax=Puccinia striiformis TaxID=27350 RepID=A0A2S4WMG7_9BASI|nr:hypothetical protein PSHT_00742 [Puccinia striiformis]